MATNARENGRMTSKRARQNSHGVMVTGMLVIGRKVNVMAVVSSSRMMAAFNTVVNGAKTFSKEKASSIGPLTIPTKEPSLRASLTLHRPRMVKAL